MKILVLGNGGREHALVHAFKQHGHVVYCLPGNAGTTLLCQPTPHQVNVRDFTTLAAFAKAYAIDLTVVGQEQFLADGLADFFAAEGLTLFGPKRQAAQMESSKVWAKAFMTRHEIPTASHVACFSYDEAADALSRLSHWDGIVVKCGGLTGGKGVTVCSTSEEALDTIHKFMRENRYGLAGHAIVLEERLEGREISLLAFADGKRMIPMVPSQDHKRLYDEDRGPNTGGIGAYAPVSFVTGKIMHQIKDEIIDRTQAGLDKEGIAYQGVIYFGLMLTKTGPKLLEYNCRFGDPEAQVVLPLLKSDPAEIMLACTQGKLEAKEIAWTMQSACCVVMASGGYPENFQTGYEIKGLDQIKNASRCRVFHAGTAFDAEGKFVTAGGRVLGITGIADNLETAAAIAYENVGKILFNDAHFRSDIAAQALPKQEVIHCRT